MVCWKKHIRRQRLLLLMGIDSKHILEYFGIPYRTLQDWELGNNKSRFHREPAYVMLLNTR